MTEDRPDITQPKTFAVFAGMMAIFGAIVGIGFHITFQGLNISLGQGLQVIFILVCMCTIIAVIFHKIPEIGAELTGDIEDEDEEEE